MQGGEGAFASQRSEAEQQALEEQELLGALAFSLAEQQAEQGRASGAGAPGEPAALVEARAEELRE